MRSDEVRRGRKIGGEERRIGDTPSSNKDDEKERAEKERRSTRAKRERGERREREGRRMVSSPLL